MANGDDHPVHPGSKRIGYRETWSLHCIRIRIPVIFVIAQGLDPETLEPNVDGFLVPL